MRVAVVQMQCNDTGDTEANIQVLTNLVEKACSSTEKPELILGPEFALCGYSYDREQLWKTAERQGGMTETFLCKVASQHGIYFGLSYLEVREVEGEPHFLNTFALAGPNGKIEGRVSKARPCSVEAYLFQALLGSCHTIECSNGYRFGVLICYENLIYDSLMELQAGPPLDLLLQPFSGPLVDGGCASTKEELRKLYLRPCPTNAKFLGCPALYCNKVGEWKTVSPTKLAPNNFFDGEFPGCSAIYDGMGKQVGRMESDEEGVLCGEVVLGTVNNQERPVIPRYLGGYVDPALFLKGCVLCEWLGAWSYNHDKRRKQMAREALERL